MNVLQAMKLCRQHLRDEKAARVAFPIWTQCTMSKEREVKKEHVILGIKNDGKGKYFVFPFEIGSSVHGGLDDDSQLDKGEIVHHSGDEDSMRYSVKLNASFNDNSLLMKRSEGGWILQNLKSWLYGTHG